MGEVLLQLLVGSDHLFPRPQLAQVSADSRNSPLADMEFPTGGHQISPLAGRETPHPCPAPRSPKAYARTAMSLPTLVEHAGQDQSGSHSNKRNVLPPRQLPCRQPARG